MLTERGRLSGCGLAGVRAAASGLPWGALGRRVGWVSRSWGGLQGLMPWRRTQGSLRGISHLTVALLLGRCYPAASLGTLLPGKLVAAASLGARLLSYPANPLFGPSHVSFLKTPAK